MSNEEIFEEFRPVLEQNWYEGWTEANKKKEPDLLGRNFTVVDGISSEREKEYKDQRLECGFDDTELWNLDSTILRFTLPRLCRFKEVTFGYPPDFESLEHWRG